MTKIDIALSTANEVINGIEDETLSTSSALLKCLKIARLLNDTEALIWLQYEYGGYPQTPEGHLQSEAFHIGCSHGRGYIKDGKQHMYTSIASELEIRIQGYQNAMPNFSTKGVSVSGEMGYIAMDNLTRSVSAQTSAYLNRLSSDDKLLSILKSQYYEYALNNQIELSFGNTVADIFTTYRGVVDTYFSKLSNDMILKLQAIEEKVNSDNPEYYSQALTTCRRLFEAVSKELFNKYLPDYSEKIYKTKSGKELDVSGDRYKNKLSVVIEVLQDKSPKKTLIGSEIIYLLDWIDKVHDLQNKGTHDDITREDATQCIIRTYICLGDIIKLQTAI